MDGAPESGSRNAAHGHGAGTRAVEGRRLPRLIGLDRAQASRTTLAERHKFSQRKVDVLDFGTKSLCTKSLEKYGPLSQMAEENGAEQGYGCRRHAGRTPYTEPSFADCQGMVDNLGFIRMMRTLMKMLEKEYERPVDVGFAVTSPEEGIWRLNLLQCRPFRRQIRTGTYTGRRGPRISL